MAYDYDKMKSAYQQLTKQQQQDWVSQNKDNANVQRFAKEYAAEIGGKKVATPTNQSVYDNSQAKSNEIMNKAEKTSNTINSLINQTSKMSGEPVEYQGQGGTTTKDPSSSPYVNQGQGKYTYNPKSGYYEVQGQTTQTQGGEKIRQFWDSLSYEEQQQKLKENPNLRASLSKYGATEKQQEVKPETKPEGGETPSEGWDYQSDSPERMAEIAANLEGYKQTMPYLFNDKRAFDDFFINGKGRSQAQIDFLNQWFENNKKYGKYDALTPDSIGYGIAYGDIPEDYLTMLKTTDPAKYQAALQAKQDAEDKIKDKTSLDTTSVLSGESEATITSKAIEWLKSQGLFLDKDGNLIDDRTENYATDEEKQYAKDAADIIARNLDIDNTVKHTYEDLVKKYPGATKATLMAMAQDTNADLLREKENNNVELTRLQGYMNYMQTERQERNRIGQNAINQLKDGLGLYYDYSPEGMSELLQAQYAASNITLDQADNGTDAQKQMALEQALTPLYDKYGSIIQRSMPQVINDVMALAKKKGISLSQALEENFLSYLRKKPEYNTLSSGGDLSGSKWAKLDDTHIFDTTSGDVIEIGGGTPTTTRAGGKATITPITASTNEATTNTLMKKYPTGSSYASGECGELMNLDASTSGSNIHFGSLLSDKTKWINRETYEGPQIGNYVVFDWSNKPGASADMRKYGHVGKIVGMGDGYIDIRNQNGSRSGEVSVDRYPLKDYEQYIAGYVDPTSTENYGYWGSPLDEAFSAIKNNGKNLNKDQKEALDFADSAYMMMYELANSGDLDYFLKSPDGQKVLSNYAAAQFSNNASYTEDQILSTLKNNVTDQRILGIVNDLMTIIEKKLRWTSGAAISGSEWNSNSKMLIPQAGESYNTQFRKFQTFEGEYLKKPFESLGGYAGVDVQYVPLFDGRSPYYKKYQQAAEQEADDRI